ncbi:hypothetical protein QYE76_032677 [Lolium multiflorum]|uniref:Transposase (putative) gypsy type domain-containing protein n=1 Tax=Lolium multiflorum TaxID=4521 RepID=A0AAD8VJK7_LOLMU|nr:hypothetical protein QYE76_032677 [Lolium multiflorum]
MAARVSTPGHSSHLTCVADDLDLLCGASISGGLQRVQALPQHLLLLSLTACAEDGGVPPTNSPLLLLGAGEDPRRPRAQWRVWCPCDVIESELKAFKKEGLVAPDSWSFTKDSITPTPAPDERVFTKAWVERGLSLPPSEFFLSVLSTYGLQLHNICPNSLMAMSSFLHLLRPFSPILLLERKEWNFDHVPDGPPEALVGSDGDLPLTDGEDDLGFLLEGELKSESEDDFHPWANSTSSDEEEEEEEVEEEEEDDSSSSVGYPPANPQGGQRG